MSLDTRDGNSERTSARAMVGATGVSLLAEGPLGGSSASWLFSARKSFLDYVVNAIQDAPSFVVGYTDAQAKISVHRGAHRLNAFLLTGTSDYADNALGLPRNDVADASASTHLATVRWMWAPSARASVTTSGFWTREHGDNRNAGAESLYAATSAQLGGRTDLRVGVGRSHQLHAGLLARRLSDRHVSTSLPRVGPATSRSAFDVSHWQPAAYVQDGWSSPAGRVAITAGVRIERSGAVQASAVTPRASTVLRVTERTHLAVALGTYAQFPNAEQLSGANGNGELVAEESRHVAVGVDHRVSTTMRLQLQAYGHREARRITDMSGELRAANGRVVVPVRATLENSLSGTSRGVELLLQRRSANGLTGWISYALAAAERRDATTGLTFDSDVDQRHTVNAYASYRLSDRTNLSAKFRFGSNVPVPGFYETAPDGGLRLSAQRNTLRLPAYSRLDIRANRTFAIRRARLTASAEILNLLNRENVQFTGPSVFFPSGRVTFNRDTAFPLLPVANLTLEW